MPDPSYRYAAEVELDACLNRMRGRRLEDMDVDATVAIGVLVGAIVATGALVGAAAVGAAATAVATGIFVADTLVAD